MEKKNAMDPSRPLFTLTVGKLLSENYFYLDDDDRPIRYLVPEEGN